mgnify:CR=1 FL=1
MKAGVSLILAGYENIDKTDEEIEKEYCNAVSKRKKYRDICKYASDKDSSIVFKLVSAGVEDRNDRLVIEAQYAHDKKAVFWSPAPGQVVNHI